MEPTYLRGYRVEGCPVEELNGLYVPVEGSMAYGKGEDEWLNMTGGVAAWVNGPNVSFARDARGWYYWPHQMKRAVTMTLRAVRLRVVEEADEEKGEGE